MKQLLKVFVLPFVFVGTIEGQTTDTVSTRPLFTTSDGVLMGSFLAVTAAAAPADRYFTRELQDEARQANRVFNRGATIFRLIGQPGGLITGGSIYLFGLAANNRRAEDLGLHTVESVLIASAVVAGVKVTVGRARPRKSPDDAANFGLFRGITDEEYRSFPSGHSAGAFAFAAVVSSETSHWWPGSRWVIGPLLYGSAALTGVSRIYNNAHWASDVIAGAAIGTLTGLKLYRYQHSHPDNRLDRYFLRAGVQASNNGSWSLILLPGI